MARKTITMARARKLVKKMQDAGVKVRQVKAPVLNLDRMGARNANQSYSAGGGRNQAYDPDTKQFTKAASSTKNGLLSVEGSNNTKGAKTWTFTNRDMEGNLISQAGRSQLSDRRQRSYDVRNGLNNISPKVVQAWIDNGMAKIVRGRLENGRGNIIRQKPDGTFSMGLTTG